MQSGLASIIIPCYNYEKYVTVAIESVLNQTYKNIELIVINDGSTDNSAEVIQDLANKHGFTFIDQKNAGVTATCARGLDLAHGEFVKFFDADDILSPDFISKTVAFLQANTQYAMVYSRAFLIDKAGNKIQTKQDNCKNCVSGFIFKDLVQDCFIVLPTTLIRTQAARDVGGFELGIALQDYQLWLKIAKKYQIGFLDEALCFYRDHGVSLSKNHSFMINRVHQTYELFANEPCVQKKLRRVYPLWFRILSKTPDKALAKKYMRLAFKSAWWSHKFWHSVIRTYLK
ncbi:MAG: glycosyltransferase family 2 protein [Helicobacteraceae bacterium]